LVKPGGRIELAGVPAVEEDLGPVFGQAGQNQSTLLKHQTYSMARTFAVVLLNMLANHVIILHVSSISPSLHFRRSQWVRKTTYWTSAPVFGVPGFSRACA
jgi:hypothetical protein